MSDDKPTWAEIPEDVRAIAREAAPHAPRYHYGIACAIIADRLSRRSTIGGAGTEPVAWRCFHCDEVFTDREAALLHFGESQDQEPICQVTAERYREVENELTAYRTESDATSTAFHALGAEHYRKERDAEQKGYDRGLADAKAYPETLGLTTIKPAPWVAPMKLCSTCGGIGEIDQRIGGEATSGIVSCPDCDGKGSYPASPPLPSPDRAKLIVTDAMVEAAWTAFSAENDRLTQCPDCAGAGRHSDESMCRTCEGNGYLEPVGFSPMARAIEAAAALSSDMRPVEGYIPQVIEFEEAGYGQLVLEDTAMIHAEEVTVTALRRMSQPRELIGFQWELPLTAAPRPVEGWQPIIADLTQLLLRCTRHLPEDDKYRVQALDYIKRKKLTSPLRAAAPPIPSKGGV